jgi:hypothetical protein
MTDKLINWLQQDIIPRLTKFKGKVEIRPIISGALNFSPLYTNKYNKLYLENCELINKCNRHFLNMEGVVGRY